MCRNIKVLFNFDPPATKDEIHEASLQFVRKVSGFREPSKVNEKAFENAVANIEKEVANLLKGLNTDSKHKNREEEARKARARSMKRFGG
jgi:hypothetical protein